MLVFLFYTSGPICTFTTAPCVISTRHCRCKIQYKTDPVITAYECNHTAPTVRPNTNPAQCLLSFHDRIAPGLHFHTHIHDPWFPAHKIYKTYNSLSPSLSRSFAIVQFGLHSLPLSTLTLCFQLWPLATNSSLGDPENYGLSLELTL